MSQGNTGKTKDLENVGGGLGCFKLNKGGHTGPSCAIWTTKKNFVFFLIFFFFWTYPVACGILIPHQGLNPCPQQ